MNTELFINNQKYEYQKYFIPQKEGVYDILLKFNINLTDCSFMFYGCKNIIKIDLSLFNSNKVKDMKNMFYGCSNLIDINNVLN